jgi:hypothetical protein
LAARPTPVRANNGKKIAFINGTKFKSLTLSKCQVALFAESRSASAQCIVNAKKNAQTGSDINTVMINAKMVAFAAKKRRTEASMDKDYDVLKNVVDDHREFQLSTKQLITLAERELMIHLCPPPISPGYSPPVSPKRSK